MLRLHMTGKSLSIGIVEHMIAVVNAPAPPPRLLLGKVATERPDQKMSELRTELANWRELALASDLAPAGV